MKALVLTAVALMTMALSGVSYAETPAPEAEKQFVPLPQTLDAQSPAFNLLEVGDPAAQDSEAVSPAKHSPIKKINCNMTGRYRICF